jgi:hypothetical protein
MLPIIEQFEMIYRTLLTNLNSICWFKADGFFYAGDFKIYIGSEHFEMELYYNRDVVQKSMYDFNLSMSENLFLIMYYYSYYHFSYIYYLIMYLEIICMELLLCGEFAEDGNYVGKVKKENRNVDAKISRRGVKKKNGKKK